MPKRSSSGFTLIELLVVISIIAILSAIGLVSYNGIRNNALKAKRISDLNAIKKAYEANYDPTLNGGQGGYKGITDSNFASGQTPKRDDGSSYIVTGPEGSGASGGNFAACINTLNGSACTSSSQPNCSCVKSDQGVPFTSPTGGSNPSCDPFGVLTQGLVGYWKFDEPSWSNGSSVIDYSGKNHTGTVGGNAIVTTHTPDPNNTFKKTGSFNGTSSFISILNSTDFQFGSGSFTLSAWINKTAVGSNTDGVISTGGNPRYLLGYGNNQVYAFVQVGTNTATTTCNLTGTGAWHLLTMIFNRTTNLMSLHIDNTACGTNANISSIGNPNPTDPLFIGKRYPAANYFSGMIDDARIYNKALSPTEISNLYNNGSGCIP